MLYLAYWYRLSIPIELTGLTRLLLFRDVTSLRPLEFSSNKDVFERFTFPGGDERWFSVYFSQQIEKQSKWVIRVHVQRDIFFALRRLGRNCFTNPQGCLKMEDDRTSVSRSSANRCQ